jgi:hypothetical protein
MTSNAREINQFQLMANTKMLIPCLVLRYKQELSKIWICFCLKLFFYVFGLFWYVDIKNNFFKKNNKILFWCISKWKTLWKATTTTLPNTQKYIIENSTIIIYNSS